MRLRVCGISIGNDRCRVGPLPPNEEDAMSTMSPMPPILPSTVLVVDDDRLMLQTLRRTLEPDGHRILTATDGFRALELCQRESMDLVILDVCMPGLSGIEVAYELRAHVATSAVPILFCTGTRGLSVPLGKLRRGVEVLLKPFDAISLQSAVRRLLEGSERGATAS
jgi:DNA-binding response OmpR family regulator